MIAVNGGQMTRRARWFGRNTADAGGVDGAAERALKLFGAPVEPPPTRLPPEQRMRRVAQAPARSRSKPLPGLVFAIPGLLLGAMIGLILLADDPGQLPKVPKAIAAAIGLPDVYLNCAHARLMGAAPLRRGDKGYQRRLDEDRDGVACEPLLPKRAAPEGKQAPAKSSARN